MQRYAILCYHDEAAVNALTKTQEATLMAELEVVRRKLEDKLGPIAMQAAAWKSVRLVNDVRSVPPHGEWS